MIVAEALVRELTPPPTYQLRVGDTFRFDDGAGCRSVVVTARARRRGWLLLHVEPASTPSTLIHTPGATQ